MADIFEVRMAQSLRKALKRVPKHIVRKLMEWSFEVELEGLSQVRKRPGYHDEPLVGKRWGQRSIRLNRSYRAIYVISEGGFVRFVEVLEVNKHVY